MGKSLPFYGRKVRSLGVKEVSAGSIENEIMTRLANHAHLTSA
jgi:hypothetical protein